MTSLAPLSADEVRRRLGFARHRLEDLLNYSGGDLSRDPSKIRLQLLQEFFFHLIGARDVVAQLINERHELKIAPEDVSIAKVLKRLNRDTLIKQQVALLTIDPRREPFPSDPYSEAGYIYRAINYRNQVTHRHRNPLCFIFNIHIDAVTEIAKEETTVHLHLDPRNSDMGVSKVAVLMELEAMYGIFDHRYLDICDTLNKATNV